MSAKPHADLFILGAGLPHKGDRPSALVNAGSRPALNWIISAAEGVVDKLHFVGGYHFEEVQAEYAGLHYSRNPDWETTGSAATLLYAPLETGASALVCYSDIVFHRSAISALAGSSAAVCVAVDSHWRDRYAGRTQADIDRVEKVVFHGDRILSLGQGLDSGVANAEFVGIVLLRPDVVALLREQSEFLFEKFRTKNISALIEWLRLSGVEVECVDVAGEWAELNEPQDLARFVMGTKAETLARLRERVGRSVIQDQISFVYRDWLDDRAGCLARVKARFGSAPLVVRSSSNREDGFSAAAAGVYTSILNVDPVTGLPGAVDEVFGSYGDPEDGEQVLVQPFIASVAMHGVIFTRTLDRGAPYYVVNYDESGDTEAITSGTSKESRTLIVHRDADIQAALAEPYRAIMAAVQELESLLNYDTLDIEFAVDREGQVHIFQVRPIAVHWGDNHVDKSQCDEAVAAARAKWRQVAPLSPFNPGGAPVFGVMPDWNPAEIIGAAPRALSASLYQRLVMDEVWAAQRAEYGYRDMRPVPLLVSFAGRPYVDVRASFSSFVPAEVDDALAGRLVSFYLEWLKARPHLHDKVEFDVVPTCMALDFERWERRLETEGGFSRPEISSLAEGLRRITAGAFTRPAVDLATIAELQARFERIRDTRDLDHGDRARLYLDDCRRLGTLPFAHLARSGFVAVTLLRSAVATGVIGADALEAFMASLNTVTRQFSDDIAATGRGELPLQTLVERYGHLRPGTYDITSPCYSEDVDNYIRPLVEASRHEAPHAADDLGPWLRDRDAFFASLASIGLPSDPAVVETFLRDAISGREFAKFQFTRNLSAALEALAALGAELGLSRDQLADLPIEALLAVGKGQPGASPARLRELSEIGREAQRVAAACPMPALLTAEQDLTAFWLMTTQPNFIGAARVRGDVVCLDKPGAQSENLAGKIVLIPSADPGYDWLFGQSIAALVTMYGGSNSHMAIRSAEFRLPAAIGVGEQLYDKLRGARRVELDAGNQQIEVLS